MLNGKSILITGGTGSFGKKFVETVLDKFPEIRKIVVYSRDELKQYEMSQKFPTSKYPAMRYLIGDVRDRARLTRAFEDIDIVIHAAALKQVPAAEYNPMECIRTNVLGAENIIEAALDTNVSRVIALSTDKAAAPVNLYGATKLCSDKLFVAANNMRGNRDLFFSVVRYGNVMGSRGSVIPFFKKKQESGVFPITHPEMTRFTITLSQAADFVIKCLENIQGGEVFVPKIPSYKILDIAKAINPDCKHEIIGIRPGEKLHEEMITADDSFNTVDCGDYYVITPVSPLWNQEQFLKKFQAKKVEQGFQYNSGTNDWWLSVEEISKLIESELQSE